MFTIDIHNHPDYYGRNAQAIVEDMDTNGIDAMVLLTCECTPTDLEPQCQRVCSPFYDNGTIGLKLCLEYQEKFPERFTLGYAPDFRLPNSLNRLKSAIRLFDICMCGEVKLRAHYDEPDAIRMWRFCGEKGLPVLMHLDYPIPLGAEYPWPDYWFGGAMEALERVLELCPETKFIGHAPGFWGRISNDDQYLTKVYPTGKVIPGGKLEQLLEKYPNLYCDMSAGSGSNAFARDPEYAVKFLTTWQDRVMYGRDHFLTTHKEIIESLPLSEEVKAKIYGLNACAIMPSLERFKK